MSYREAVVEAARFIDAQRVPGQVKWRRTDKSKGPGDYSLYHGDSGIVLLWLELHEASRESRWLQAAAAAGDEILRYVGGVDWLSVSPSRGWPSYAFVLGELARATGRDDFRVAAGACLDRLVAQSEPLGSGIGWVEPAPFADITGFSDRREIFDQSVGAAGAGLVLLYAHRQGLHSRALEWATATAERLLEVAESDPAGLRWKLMADMPFAFTAPNFAHGGAGVAYFLAELYRLTGDPRLLEAALSGARYVLSKATPQGDGFLVCHTEEARNPLFYLGACHGPPGTGRLFLALNEITGDPAWLDHARGMVLGLQHLGAPETRSKGFWRNHGQCCGDAGVGEFALLMGRRTGETGYVDLARRCADEILRQSELKDGARRWVQAEHRDRPEFLEAQTGYMQGAAGIASFLLHLDTTLAGQPVKIALPDWPT
jgi:lantibiotic modifying enzyme